MIQLETERLIMRPIIPDDAEDMYLLNLDPDVVRYTGDIAFTSVEDSFQFYSKYDDYARHKMGRFSTFLKEGNVFIGWCGLKQLETDVDLGYRFMKEYWGKGYATESSVASLDYGFDEIGLDRIVAIAFKENVASYNIMKKLGMGFLKELDYEGRDAVQYEIIKQQWLEERKRFKPTLFKK